MSDIIINNRISKILSEYAEKEQKLAEACENFASAGSDLVAASTVSGTYGNTNLNVGGVSIHSMQESLLKSAWYSVYNLPGFKQIMSSQDKRGFENDMLHPPEFTLDNIRATFGDYVLNPMDNILRGFAEVFTNLDTAYKSHEKVKIGVKKLPKRIILSGFNSYSYYGYERLEDVINALAAYQSKPLVKWHELRDLEEEPYKFQEKYGFFLKFFLNGNAHVHFDEEALLDINRALAAYYGDVLPDCYSEDEAPASSSSMSKELQYYPTPLRVCDRLIDDLYIEDHYKILEPSCGCGRIMGAIQKKNKNARIYGIEAHSGRADTAREKGYSVLTGNFLEMPPRPIYDLIVMNPPFYGTHYADHVKHALSFLKDGGTLKSILPATARYDHGILEGFWQDLPNGSFSESGTNISTSTLTIRK